MSRMAKCSRCGLEYPAELLNKKGECPCCARAIQSSYDEDLEESMRRMPHVV
jgi:predicted Zn-ribbon and HTH transcriptional regulator